MINRWIEGAGVGIAKSLLADRYRNGHPLLTLLGTLLTTSLSLTTQAATPFTTAGNFSVGSDGSANYSIPIQVPPGTAGMAPTLSLNYNSNGGNGILGMGWGLDGLSQISRCPQTIAQDDQIRGVSYDSGDRFCIDGQRLIATSDTYQNSTNYPNNKIYKSTAAYGANGTEYRTESANFAKIISYTSNIANGPDYFKVWTKAGQIIEYGNTTDSRIEAQGKTAVRTWGVNKIADTKSNYLTVTYTEDNLNGEAYVQRIDYTGNPNATPVLAPYASVQFTYEARPDTSTGYQAGSKISTTKRLTNIKTYLNSLVVKDYRLTYEQSTSTQRSRLKTLTECDGNTTTPTCLQPMAVGWTNSGASFSAGQNWGTGGGNGYWPYYTTPTSQSFQFTGDFNGDGKTDFMYWESMQGWKALLATGSGFSAGQNWGTGGGNGYWPYYTTPTSQSFQFTGDFNGDGKTDFMYWESMQGWKSLSDNFPFPDLLTTLTPGLSSTVSLTYKPITDGSIYVKDASGAAGTGVCPMPLGNDGVTTNSYPVQNIQEPQYVVSTATVSDGNGGVLTNNYSYGGAKAHLLGRGALGFRYQKVTQADADINTTTFFRQDYPYIGLPCQVEKRITSTSTLLGASQITYGNKLLTTGSSVSQYPYVAQSVEQSFDLNGGALLNTTTTTNTYDDWGNALQIKVDSGDGYIKTTDSIYLNDSTNWLLGRLLKSTVTSTTP